MRPFDLRHKPVLAFPAFTPPTAALALARIMRPPNRRAPAAPQLLAFTLGSRRLHRRRLLRDERLDDDLDARLTLRFDLEDPVDGGNVRIFPGHLPIGLDAFRTLRDEEVDRLLVGPCVFVVVIVVDVDDFGLAGVAAVALLGLLLLGFLLLSFLFLLSTL